MHLFIENKFDIPEVDIELFYKILLCILQMTLRDEISQFWRRQSNINHLEVLNNERNAKIQNEYEILEKKFAALFLPQTQFNEINSNEKYEKNNFFLNNKMSATFVFQK